MRQTKVSCNSWLYSETQKVCTLRVKKGHLNKVFMSSRYIQPQGQAVCSKNNVFFFPIEAYKGWFKHLIG